MVPAYIELWRLEFVLGWGGQRSWVCLRLKGRGLGESLDLLYLWQDIITVRRISDGDVFVGCWLWSGLGLGGAFSPWRSSGFGGSSLGTRGDRGFGSARTFRAVSLASSTCVHILNFTEAKVEINKNKRAKPGRIRYDMNKWTNEQNRR